MSLSVLCLLVDFHELTMLFVDGSNNGWMVAYPQFARRSYLLGEVGVYGADEDHCEVQ